MKVSAPEMPGYEAHYSPARWVLGNAQADADRFLNAQMVAGAQAEGLSLENFMSSHPNMTAHGSAGKEYNESQLIGGVITDARARPKSPTAPTPASGPKVAEAAVPNANYMMRPNPGLMD